MPLVSTQSHQRAARRLAAMAARHARVRDLLPLGAYVQGGDPETDRAVELYPRIEKFLNQGVREAAPLDVTIAMLEELMA